MDDLPAAYGGPDDFIFVCYAHADRDLVYPEIARLVSAGFKVWYDEGIQPGSEWNAAIADAIQRCAGFLYMVSPASVASEHCRREVNFALEEKRAAIALHLLRTQLPAALRLSLGHRQGILKYSDTRYFEKMCAALRGEDAAHARNQKLTLAEASIDFGTRTLTLRDESTQLDPKDISVLTHLIDTYPDVVPTEELLSRSWPGTVVGDNALQQVIARLRKAFHDDARNPRFIETVPRSGYRLLVSATPIEEPSSPLGGSAFAWFYAFGGLVALVALTFWWFGRADSMGDHPKILDFDTKKSVAVLDFVDLTPGGEYEGWGQGLAMELRRHIEGFGNFTSVPAVLLRGRAISDLAGDVDIVVDGVVQVDGDNVDISLDATDLVSGELLWSKVFTGKQDDLRELQRSMATSVARYFDQSIAGASYWGPKHPDAYPLFLKYLHYSHGGRSEDYEAVIHQILAIEPTWLDGWNSLADSMIWRVPRLRDLNRLVIAREAIARTQEISGDPNFGAWHEAYIQFFFEGRFTDAISLLVATESYGSLAFFMHSAGMVREARRYWLKQVEGYEYTTTWDVIAMAEAFLGNWQTAVEYSEKCAQFAPKGSYNCFAGQVYGLPRTDLARARALLAEIESVQPSLEPGTSSYIGNENYIDALKLGIAAAEGLSTADIKVRAVLQNTANRSSPTSAYFALMLGDEEMAAKEFAEVQEQAVFWRFAHLYAMSNLSADQRAHPIFRNYERALGYTDELRLELCHAANHFRDKGLYCNPEYYQASAAGN